jgi:cardiolipin synthase A/B
MDKSNGKNFSEKNIRKIYGARFTDNNKVTLLWREHESFRKIFDAIRKANELICLVFYIYRNDETGKELTEILKQKARDGIKVYLIYDHFGSISTPWKFWRDMKDSGVHIKASHPFKWSSPLHYIHRDHRKLIIIDGSLAFIGGLNIADEYRGYLRKRKKGWRDTGIFMEGPVADILLEQFKKSWVIWGGAPIEFNNKVDPVLDGVSALPVFATSARDRRRMRKLIYYSINSASKSIYLTTAYFAPSRRMIQVLENAVQRGVDVKLLLPGKSDIYAVSYAGRAFFTKLLRAGVKIFTYQGEILHAKTSVFDEEWSIIGSANLDFQSLRRNDEGNVGIVDSAFGKQMVDIFNEDLNNSTEIILDDWLNRPLSEKMKEHFFALFRRRL